MFLHQSQFLFEFGTDLSPWKTVCLAAILDNLRIAKATDARDSAHLEQQSLFAMRLLRYANEANSKPDTAAANAPA